EPYDRTAEAAGHTHGVHYVTLRALLDAQAASRASAAAADAPSPQPH
ncbi:hypothetical protein B1M_23980, partial [Burkholderia sp. TJI49]